MVETIASHQRMTLRVAHQFVGHTLAVRFWNMMLSGKMTENSRHEPLQMTKCHELSGEMTEAKSESEVTLRTPGVAPGNGTSNRASIYNSPKTRWIWTEDRGFRITQW